MGHAHISVGSTVIRERRWSHAPSRSSGPDAIGRILENYRTLAVVGLSSRPTRPSHGVAAYMQARGYRIIPVNPHEESVLEEKCYSSLEDVPGPLEVVVIFRRPECVPEVVEAAIRCGAKVVWMQIGVESAEAAQKAQRVGVTVVENQCIMVQHRRLRIPPAGARA